jgi:adenylate cyclase
VDIQEAMRAHGADVSPDARIAYRVGMTLGDIMVEDGDIFGDDVNIAARLESLADPGGILVSQAVHDYVGGKLPVKFVDRGEQSVKNISRPIRAFSVEFDAGPAADTTPKAYVIDSIPRLSIVVLPFDNLSNDPEQEYFADSLVEDLTSDLSRIVGSFVIARNTAFTYKGTAIDARKLRQDLGVNYMLEGSVRRLGNRIRVNSQLIDTRTGGHVWADRFDGDVADLFALQDSITSNLATTLSLEMIGNAAQQAEQSTHPDAIDLVMRGRAAALRPRDKGATQEARRYFEQALAIASESSEAKTGLAEILVGMVLSLMSDDRERDLAQADALVSQALAVQSGSAWAHYVKGEVLRVSRRTDEAALEYQAALFLNRNYAPARGNLAYCKILVGQPDEAIPLLHQTIKTSPRDPLLAIWHSRIGQAELYAGRYEAAKTEFELSIGLNPGLVWNHLYLAGVFGLLADREKAAASLATAQRLSNDLSSIGRYKTISQVSHPRLMALREETLIQGLRLAGLPEQ